MELDVQVPWLASRFYRHFLPKYLHRADTVLTVSEFTKKDIAATCGINPLKIKVLPNGSRDGFRPLSAAEKEQTRLEYANGKSYFFYTGTIHPRKNLHRMIAAFDQFKAQTGSSMQFLIAGRMLFQTAEVTAAYQHSAYRDDIHLLGYVEEAALFRMMGAASALVYASLGEGFGMPVLEAMNAEIPVITSNNSALVEIAEGAAYLVDPLSVQAIVAAMCKVVGDEQTTSGLVHLARKRRERFSWDVTAEGIFEALLCVAR